MILVPIGGGSSASGCCIVRTGLGSRAKVIGVQAEGADAFTRSWRTGTRVVGERAETFAEGMATRVTFDLTFGILQRELDDVVTLTEEELAEGVRLALRTTHNLAEGAGAAPLAAAMKLRDRLAGRKSRVRDERRQHRRRDPPPRAWRSRRSDAEHAEHAEFKNRHDSVYCDNSKFTVTVMITGTATPFSSVGVNFHCRTASSAA